MGIYRKAIHAIDNRGIRGIVRDALARFSRQPDPAPIFNESTAPHPFDLAHNVDTSGFIPGEQVPGNSPSDLYSTAYYGISPSSLAAALELLPEPATGFTFVDLGCGKGRALLVAAQFDFTKLLGLEISPELCRIAESNTRTTPRIEIRQQDVVTLAFPATPLVIFLYHPFLAPILRRVLANLERHHRTNPHPTYLLYANNTYSKLLARFQFLQQVWDYSIPLSPEDTAADRHRITHEGFTLYRAT